MPERKKLLYRPPHKPVGASAIGYLSDPHIRITLQQLRAAWLEGHEIGTHFNGPFCDAAEVGTWSPADWRTRSTRPSGSWSTGGRTPASATSHRCRSTTARN